MAKKKTSKEKIEIEKEVLAKEDVVFEDDNEMVKRKIEKLRKQLKECEKEKQEYLLGWQRARADAINKKKEVTEEKQRIVARTQEEAIAHFLPVLDSFDMAFANRKAWNTIDKNWRVGIEHIYTQVLKIFEIEGVEIIDTPGEKFNPKWHEPIEIKKVSVKESDDTVLSVIQKGYKKGTTVLRPAKVVIGKLNK